VKQQRLLLYANAGLFCDGYILSSIGIALVALPQRFHPDPALTGLIGGTTLLGILVGAPLFGHFTDRFGRRILMIADLGVFVVVCLAQAFVSNAWELIALRFILGLAIGADYPIAAALIGESVPQRVRGASVNSMQVAWFLGAAIAYAAGYALLRLTGGFAAAVSRVGAALGTFALPSLMSRYGIGSIVTGSLVLSAVGLLVAVRWAPETKGSQLT
jgi:putative MFS transporter